MDVIDGPVMEVVPVAVLSVVADDKSVLVLVEEALVDVVAVVVGEQYRLP